MLGIPNDINAKVYAIGIFDHLDDGFEVRNDLPGLGKPETEKASVALNIALDASAVFFGDLDF